MGVAGRGLFGVFAVRFGSKANADRFSAPNSTGAYFDGGPIGGGWRCVPARLGRIGRKNDPFLSRPSPELKGTPRPRGRSNLTILRFFALSPVFCAFHPRRLDSRFPPDRNVGFSPRRRSGPFCRGGHPGLLFRKPTKFGPAPIGHVVLGPKKLEYVGRTRKRGVRKYIDLLPRGWAIGAQSAPRLARRPGGDRGPAHFFSRGRQQKFRPRWDRSFARRPCFQIPGEFWAEARRNPAGLLPFPGPKRRGPEGAVLPENRGGPNRSAGLFLRFVGTLESHLRPRLLG